MDAAAFGESNLGVEIAVDEADAGPDIVGAAGQFGEHRFRRRPVGWFAENDAVENNLGVGAEHQRAGMSAGNGAGFGLGVVHDEDIRCEAAGGFRDAVGLNHAEAQAHCAQEQFPARGGAGEDDFGFVQAGHRRYLFRHRMSKVEHLYVHVPFCAAKCKYCAFYSEAGNAARMEAYVVEAIGELKAFSEGRTSAWPWPVNGCAEARPCDGMVLKPRTIFFGGGTPSLLPAALMRRILEHIPAQQVQEWTIECNPATLSAEKLRLFREFGVNRISLGVQALDDAMLEVLGRVHSADSAVRSYERLRVAGFENINLDLMFGLPGQTRAQWRETLRRAVALQPEHISTYCLILEEDTEFWRLFQAGQFKPQEQEELAMYEEAMEVLAGAGYRQYEVSNFARPGRECAHNIAYWEGRDYLGIGPSACSTVGDRRWQNSAAMSGWTVESVEVLTPALRTAERVAFGMRMTAGVPAMWVRGRWDRQVTELLSADLVEWRDGRLRPTRRGILFADAIAAEFV